MLRLILRSVAINLACVFITAQILSGIITYVGGYRTLLMAALAISLVNLFVKPVTNLLLLPINLLTQGLFRWISNLIALYVVTWLVPSLIIHEFQFPGANLVYLIIPPINFTAFGAFIVVTLTLTVVFHFIYWLLQE